MNRQQLLFRLLTPAIILLAALLACTSGAVSDGGGHVTPFGSAVLSATPTIFFPTDSPTLTPTAAKAFTPLPPLVPGETLLYRVQSGDTLDLLAGRFNAPLDELLRLNNLSASDSLVEDELILVPARLDQTGPDFKIIPDSELVYSLGVAGFDIGGFIESQGGYLARHREYVRGAMRTSAEIVQMAALDNSISPRILLAILEYRSGWVTNPTEPEDKMFPIVPNQRRQGLFNQLDWLADTLNPGYYRWRDGAVTALDFPDSEQMRIYPALNAGTVSLQYFFSRLYNESEWEGVVGPDGLHATFTALFGDPFERAVEPLIPPGLTQPEFQLPFESDTTWLFISGPHAAWEPGSPWAALDFAPPSETAGCFVSDQWVTAPAAGVVARSEAGVVVIDLDGDGREQSGWAILLLHIAEKDRVPAGANVEAGDLIGHPSCEGGRSTGTHVHIARKFNGEWIPADGSIPFDLSGWVAHFGPREYKGTMTKGGDTITACECSAEVAGISIGR
ncbi:MAG: LysM peptidoglycan-binding domain-containing protein [Chloroflexi bacterium]|nr:LysM peptidoglycan-binding domain-containing protein [Chloroflexota bacterium]